MTGTPRRRRMPRRFQRVVPAQSAGVPSFDLVLLGLGDDAHTASLLPGDPLVYERERLVAVTNVEREGTIRLTFTAPLLWAARDVLFLVAGADKASALGAVLSGPEQIEQYPAQLLRQARGDVTFLTDSAAAAEVS
jgi:6-phosphogluconolactonase